jgi:hypothetical protein
MLHFLLSILQTLLAHWILFGIVSIIFTCIGFFFHAFFQEVGRAEMEGELQELYYGMIKDLENDLKASDNQCEHLTDAMHKLSEENLELKTANDNYKWVVDHFKLGSHMTPSISSIGYQEKQL